MASDIISKSIPPSQLQSSQESLIKISTSDCPSPALPCCVQTEACHSAAHVETAAARWCLYEVDTTWHLTFPPLLVLINSCLGISGSGSKTPRTGFKIYVKEMYLGLSQRFGKNSWSPALYITTRTIKNQSSYRKRKKKREKEKDGPPEGKGHPKGTKSPSQGESNGSHPRPHSHFELSKQETKFLGRTVRLSPWPIPEWS